MFNRFKKKSENRVIRTPDRVRVLINEIPPSERGYYAVHSADIYTRFEAKFGSIPDFLSLAGDVKQKYYDELAGDFLERLHPIHSKCSFLFLSYLTSLEYASEADRSDITARMAELWSQGMKILRL